MKRTISDKEASQLRKQGYDVTAGEIVDVENMPEWIAKRAMACLEPMSEEVKAERDEAARFDAECARPVNASELRGLARALGADRNPQVRELLSI